MPHTASRYQQDLGFPDGRIRGAIGDLTVYSTAGTVTPTRSAGGNWNYAIAASTTAFFGLNVSNQLLRRTGFFEDLQEQFGSTSGSGIPASAQPQAYRPDVIGAMSSLQQLTPRTALKVKGYRLLSFDTIYTVTGAAFGTLQSGVYLNQLKNATAVSPTTIVTQAANGLTNTVQSTPYVINYALTTSQLQAISNPAGFVPGYVALADQDLWIELAVVTGASATGVFYGFDCLLEFNFN
jgi:hypothetical protein